MGMSASQARLLTLTARLSDLELQAQQISNSKLRLAVQTEGITKAYSDSLNKKKLTIMTGYNEGTAIYSNVTFDNLTGVNAATALLAQYGLTDSSGHLLVTQEQSSNFEKSTSLETFLAEYGASSSTGNVDYYTNLYNKMCEGYITSNDEKNTINNPTWLQQEIINGNLMLAKVDNGVWKSESWSSDQELVEQTDDAGDAKAEADYSAATAEIEVKDKQFDLQLKNIDTEHSAIQTEIESVGKVINKNIERTFKIFDA